MEAVRPSPRLEPFRRQWLEPGGRGVGGEAARFHTDFKDTASGQGDSFDMGYEKKKSIKDVTKVSIPGN